MTSARLRALPTARAGSHASDSLPQSAVCYSFVLWQRLMHNTCPTVTRSSFASEARTLCFARAAGLARPTSYALLIAVRVLQSCCLQVYSAPLLSLERDMANEVGSVEHTVQSIP